MIRRSSVADACAVHGPLRLGWFIHENVRAFPLAYLMDKLGQKYACEECVITPQRFGKPMNRPLATRGSRLIFARLRRYRIFYDKKKFVWKGPPLQELLRLLLPLRELTMDADDLYFFTKSQQALPDFLTYRALFVVSSAHWGELTTSKSSCATQPAATRACTRGKRRMP